MKNQEELQERALDTSATGGVQRTSEVRVDSPLTDILETSDGFELSVDLPGADPASLDVTFEDEILKIRAKARLELPEGFTLALAEFESGDYQRSFSVGEHVDADGIAADLRHGVLTVRLPKAKPANRRIEIATS